MMRSDERGSVASGVSARRAMFSGPDISMQVEQLEQRIAQQVGDGVDCKCKASLFSA